MKDNNVELITKLEQAKAGSRDLDVAIWHLVETRFQRSEIMVGWSIVPRGNRTVKDDVFAPSYSTSLDSALTLVLEGMGIIQMCLSPHGFGTVEWPGVDNYVESKTLPLALYIASLKARA